PALPRPKPCRAGSPDPAEIRDTHVAPNGGVGRPRPTWEKRVTAFQNISYRRLEGGAGSPSRPEMDVQSRTRLHATIKPRPARRAGPTHPHVRSVALAETMIPFRADTEILCSTFGRVRSVAPPNGCPTPLRCPPACGAETDRISCRRVRLPARFLRWRAPR